MKKVLISLIALTLFIAQPIYSEIVKVTVYWNAVQCDAKCERFLERLLKSINGVREIKMFDSGGATELYWKPRANFKWEYVNLAMKKLGLKLQETEVTIRGTVTRSGNRFYITSLGDSTRLELLSPSLRSDREYVEENNVLSHIIGDPLKAQLIEAQKNQNLVTVNGPLFQPYRGGNYIIVNSINVTKP